MVHSGLVKELARECGFEISGIARAVPSPDSDRYSQWVARGMAGTMGYLTDRRAHVRSDPKLLLPAVKSIICVGALYNTRAPSPEGIGNRELGWISRYAWGDDYHDVLRSGLTTLATRLQAVEPFEFKICVDTAPLLERSYARDAGLGWIGKNTCLINQPLGSWFFLGEILTSLELEPDSPPPDRCGTCTRCIDACPTEAIVPSADDYALDARLCISYFTIESRDAIPEAQRTKIGPHIFGCDICQDVCPWNRKAPFSEEPHFQPSNFAPPLEKLAHLSGEEFRLLFSGSPVIRSKYAGFLGNVAIAMGNSGAAKFRDPLEKLAKSPDPTVAEHALWALGKLNKEG